MRIPRRPGRVFNTARTARGRAIVAPVAAALALLGAGCGNNPYPPGETARPILYTSLGDDPKTLDPSVSYSTTESPIIDLIYPSFFQYHYLKRDPFVLELALGAEEPTRTPQVVTVREKDREVQVAGEVWTFRIKKNLRFQDDPCFPGGRGREITASDFLFAFRRMADPSVSCPVRSFVEDKIVGFAEYVAANQERVKRGGKADYDALVGGLQSDPRDPYTFRIVLSQPYPQLRFLMAMHFTTPLAREAALRYGADLARHPVGCGPYVLSELRPKQRLILTVNPNRRREFFPSEGAPGDRAAGRLRDAGRPLPLTEKIVFTIIREGVTDWNLFLQGYQDAAGVSQTNFQQVMSRPGQLSPEMARKGVQMNTLTGVNVWYFAFHMDDPVVGGYTKEKRTLRQAISLALDSQAFIDLFRQGSGTPAQFSLPPGIFGYDPDFRNPYRRYNVARAKALLAQAGYPGGVDKKTGERLTLFFDNVATTASERQFVGLVEKQLDAIGIRLQSRSWRSNVWRDRVQKYQFQFIRYSWYADYPDPENFLFLLYSPNVHPGPNHARYRNPEYGRLFEQMRAMDDGPERLALIRRLRAIAVEDCPWIYLWHDDTTSLHYDWLANVQPHPLANDTLKYWAVDGPRRARLQAAWNRPNFVPAVAAVALLIAGSLPAVSVVHRRRHRRVRRATHGGNR